MGRGRGRGYLVFGSCRCLYGGRANGGILCLNTAYSIKLVPFLLLCILKSGIGNYLYIRDLGLFERKSTKPPNQALNVRPGQGTLTKEVQAYGK